MGLGSASGASCWNFFHCEREMQSAIEFCLEGICCALTVMLHLSVTRTSSCTIAITLLDLDVELLGTCTTAMLSMWKRIRLLDKELRQVNIAT